MVAFAARASSLPSPEPAAAVPSGTRANTARQLCVALQATARDIAERSGLPPPAGGLCLALTVLWSRAYKFDAVDPNWPDRDRFLLSGADATPVLRALLRLSGHESFPQTAASWGHDTGSPPIAPGQVIAIATGMALAERAQAARFGKSLVDHRVWVATDAAGLTQGVTQEAAALAGQFRLDRLVLMVDTRDTEPDDARARFASMGWAVKTVDADDAHEIDAALSFAVRSRKPTLLWCVTLADAPEAPCGANPNALEAWRRVGARGSSSRRAWLKRLAHHAQRLEFERAHAGRLPESVQNALGSLAPQWGASRTRQSSAALCYQLIDHLAPSVPELLCGRLDNGVSVDASLIQPGQFSGRYMACNQRAHGMVACLNGVALHGGSLPFAVTAAGDVIDQLPALRLAAMLGRRMVHLVFEDAFSTHAAGPPPTELLAWLRAIPNLHVFRPGCGIEAAECMELALRRSDGPSILMISPNAAAARHRDRAAQSCARGGYVLAEADGPRKATLIASGRGLGVALAAREHLNADGIAVAVVSLPCWALFGGQDATYQRSVLGDAPRFGLEAAVRAGWDRWLNDSGDFIGLHDPCADGSPDPRQPTGLTPELVAQTIKRRMDC